MSKLKIRKFLDGIVADVAEVDYCDSEFHFVLIRWSKEDPYWCVFPPRVVTNDVNFDEIDGLIGGHYCIAKNENFHDVLDMIVDTGWKVSVHRYIWSK